MTRRAARTALVRLGVLAMAILIMGFATAATAAADVTLNDEGIGVSIKGMGSFNLGYPVLSPGDRKPVQRKISGKSADLGYAENIGVRVEVAEGGKVNLRFTNAGSVKSFHLSTQIGPRFGDEGGTWSIGKGGPQRFPAAKPATPHLFQGNAGGFTLVDGIGHTFSVTGFPDYAYQEFSDLREWGWKMFAWKVSVPYNPGWVVYSFVISETPHSASAAALTPKAKFLVDRFGQTTLKDFPDKVKDETELRADATAEAAYWATYEPPAVDKWGGLPGSKEKLGLRATGFFRVEKKGDRWLLVTPDGNVTFHLGICVFNYNPGDETTYIEGRREIYEWLPSPDGEFAAAYHPDKWWHDKAFSFYTANVIRKYGRDTSKDEQLGRLIDRVRAVGFNAAGAFSGTSPAFVDKHFPRMQTITFTPELPGIRGVPDPFDEEGKQKTEQSWAKILPKSADDPLIIGYFFGNEQAFEDIPRGVPQLPSKYAAKRKLVEMLQQKYPTIAEFNAAWNLQMADFGALADKGLPVTTRAAFADMQAYTEVFLDAYFRFLAETFRKYDKNHLMVSNRWQPGTANNETLCRIAGKYMDVISINYYTWGVDRSFVERLHKWTGGKPQMWSEFFLLERRREQRRVLQPRSGHADFARPGLRNYVEQAAALGFVVGIEWLSLVDQAVTGRWFSKLNGERANNGLFNVCDRPYDPMLREMAKSHEVVVRGAAEWEEAVRARRSAFRERRRQGAPTGASGARPDRKSQDRRPCRRLARPTS